MKANRKSVLALIGAMAMGAAMAAPSVEIVSVQQQYPWTNTVDIVYNVTGVAGDEGYFVTFTPLTSENEKIPDVNGQYDLQVALTNSGTYTAQWYPQTNLQYMACKMMPAVYRGAVKDYMIVDLVTGAVTYEPMATQEASNQRYNTDEYKTKKLVLRRIEADTYTIGYTQSKYLHGKNTQHEVLISRDYYLGIFPVTTAQYNYVMTGSDTSGAMEPKIKINWNTVRGSALPIATPTTGFCALLNAKTQLVGFDLPTESMWEVGARARILGQYVNDVSSTELSNYAWVNNTTNKACKVGLKLPNAWGFYDVTGNVREWCRDVGGDDELKDRQPDGLVPTTTGTMTTRQVRGSYYGNGGQSAQVDYRLSQNTTLENNMQGFRISFLAPAN